MAAARPPDDDDGDRDDDNNPVLKEKEHVHEIYSQIATHFSDTRYKPWPKIAEFLESLPDGSIVADVGQRYRHMHNVMIIY